MNDCERFVRGLLDSDSLRAIQHLYERYERYLYSALPPIATACLPT